MTRTLRAAAFLTAFAPLATALATDARAQSCGMGEVDFYPTEHRNVAQASDLLSRGDTAGAARLLEKTWPRLHEATPVASSVPVIADGVRLMALAAVRSDGDIPAGPGWSSATAEARAHNVAWGVSRLRMLVKASGGTDESKADLGEALARAPETRDEASLVLEDLDRRNAIHTPEAFAALALVRGMTGDTTGADLAAGECERLSSTYQPCVLLGGRASSSALTSR